MPSPAIESSTVMVKSLVELMTPKESDSRDVVNVVSEAREGNSL